MVSAMDKNLSKDPALWLDEYGDMLFRYAVTRVSDPAIAEDLMQETFLAAMKGKERFSGRSTERTWLVGILKHKIIDHYRKSKREVLSEDLEIREAPADEYFDRKGTWKVTPNEWLTNPTRAFEQKEFFSILHACLEKVQEKQRKAFMMRELEGADPDEICSELDITATNLWVLLYRARISLKRCLEINWFERSEASQ